MKLTELLSLLENIGPLAISDEFCKKHNFYDNSGILVDCGTEIEGALFSLDLSDGAIAEAKRRGLNAIVTHHPAIYGPLSNVSVNDTKSRLITECVKSGISVISMHLNFDAAPEGIDYQLMQGLGGLAGKTLVKLTGGAYGRVYDVVPRKMNEYIAFVKKSFNSERVIAYGDMQKTIKRAASFCGAGCDDESIAFAVEEGADVYVSADMKHHQITELLARGLNVIVLTHYASENYGFRKIYEKIIEGLNIPSAYYCDGGLL